VLNTRTVARVFADIDADTLNATLDGYVVYWAEGPPRGHRCRQGRCDAWMQL
jgi:hypothetical protein